MNYLVVVGDAKTYEHFIELKRAYGNELAWLLPFPGEEAHSKELPTCTFQTLLQCRAERDCRAVWVQ